MDGQVWLTTATPDGHDFYALCLDADTGEIIHNEHLFHCEKPEPLGNNMNNYAACSSAIEPGRVYVHFGSYGTACLDTSTGKTIWKRDDMPCRHYRGPSSSVVLFENLAILTFDGADYQYVTALDKATGETVWRTDRDVEWNDRESHRRIREICRLRQRRRLPQGPQHADHRRSERRTVAGERRRQGHLWLRPAQRQRTLASPLRRLVRRPGALVQGWRRLHRHRPDAPGAVGREDRRQRRRHRQRRRLALKTSVPKTASPLLVDGLIYMVNDDGVASCVDAKTGDVQWKKRIGGRYAASPIYADGHIYFFNQDGETVVIEPGRKFKQLATNTLDDGFLASPAVADGALFLRTKTHLYRIDAPKQP